MDTPTIVAVGTALVVSVVFPMVRSMYEDLKSQINALKKELADFKQEFNDHRIDSVESRYKCAKANDCKT